LISDENFVVWTNVAKFINAPRPRLNSIRRERESVALSRLIQRHGPVSDKDSGEKHDDGNPKPSYPSILSLRFLLRTISPDKPRAGMDKREVLVVIMRCEVVECKASEQRGMVNHRHNAPALFKVEILLVDGLFPGTV
jgi:hypothetical protein